MTKIKELRKLSKDNVIGRDEFICHSQRVEDIVRAIRRGEFESREFVKKIVKFFKKSEDIKTCELVWKFLREYIYYQAEPKTRQTGKTIAYFFVSRTGDCKHFATTNVGILNACGIPAWFVVVRQSGDLTSFHAYCQAMVNNRIVTIDPCRNTFNTECRFVKKYNIHPVNKK